MTIPLSLVSLITGTVAPFIVSGALRRDREKRKQDWITAAGILPYGFCCLILQALLLHAPPHSTVDAALWRFDQSFFGSPLTLMRWIQPHRILWLLIYNCIYVGVPYVMGVAWIVEQNMIMRRAVVIGGLICWFTYAAFPACGPSYYANTTNLTALQNAMPSMHVSFALIMALTSRSWLRTPLRIYAALMAFATVAVGEHYIFDLIAAVPYSFAMEWIAVRMHFHTLKTREKMSSSDTTSIREAIHLDHSRSDIAAAHLNRHGRSQAIN